MSVLEIQLFGPPQIHLDGQPIHKFPTSRALALLVYLASSGQPEQRDHLATVLWPDKTTERSRMSLRQCLRRLKRSIEPETKSDQPFIIATQTTLQLNPAVCQVDVLEARDALTRLKKRGNHEDGDPKSDLMTVSNRYRGRFLDRFVGIDSILFEEWVEGQQAYWQDRALQSMTQLVEFHIQEDENEEGLTVAQRYVEIEPWDEIGHQLVLECLWRLGNRAGAMQHYEEMKVELDEELGVEPSARTEQIYQRVLNEDPPPLAPLTAESTPKVAKIPFMAPPVQSIFVGRDQFLEGAAESLMGGNDVALYGLPGVGKTSLASAIANRPEVRDHFPDGVLWVGLGQNPNLLLELTHWDYALGIEAKRLELLDSVDERANVIYQEIQGKKMLLVIDDVWDLKQGLTFRLGGHQCVHLMTTRFANYAYDFAGSMAFQVPEVSLDAGLQLLSQLAPDVTAAEPEEARFLVEAVGALPLALILIGKYLQKQSHHKQTRRLKQALEKLREADERLKLTLPQSPIDRHPSLSGDTSISLQSIIGLSDAVLPPAGHNALVALSLFAPKPHQFTEAAACAVISGAGQEAAALEQIDLLVDHGLLEPMGNDRFTIHQTITDFAGQFSVTVDQINRFVDHYVDFLIQYTYDFSKVDDKHLNILEALDYAAELKRSKTFATLLYHLYPYLENWALREETQTLYEQGMALAAENRDVTAEAYLQNVIGQMSFRIGELEKAEDQYRKTIGLSQQERLLKLESDTYRMLGYMLVRTHRPEEALDLMQSGLKILNNLERPDPVREAQMLVEIGTGYFSVSHLDRGIFYYNKALEWRSEIGDLIPIGHALSNSGAILAETGKFEAAIARYEEALQIYRKLEATHFEGAALNNLGLAYKNLGDWDKAELYLERNLNIREQLEDFRGLATTYANLGIMHLLRADFKTARELFESSYEIAIRRGISSNKLDQLDNLAHVDVLEGRYDDAIEKGNRILDHVEEIKNHSALTGYAHYRIGLAKAGLSKWKEAEQALWQAREAWAVNEMRVELVEADVALAEIYMAQNRIDEANERLEPVRAYLAETTAGLSDPVNAFLVCYDVALARGESSDTAAAWLHQAQAIFLKRLSHIEAPDLQTRFHVAFKSHRHLHELVSSVELVPQRKSN